MIKQDWKRLFLREKLLIVIAITALICEIILQILISTNNSNATLLLFMGEANIILEFATLLSLLYNLFCFIFEDHKSKK